MSKITIFGMFVTMAFGFQAQSFENESHRLVGSWRLISVEGHSSDGSVSYDWGREPLGLVMFGADGHMSLHILKSDRVNFTSGDFLRPSPEEMNEAFLGYFGYFGTYTVEDEAKVVTFHVEGAAYPNYMGSDQLRFFVFEGNRLILRTPPERAGGADITYFVTWEREN